MRLIPYVIFVALLGYILATYPASSAGDKTCKVTVAQLTAVIENNRRAGFTISYKTDGDTFYAVDATHGLIAQFDKDGCIYKKEWLDPKAVAKTGWGKPLDEVLGSG
jgi:hypothetical protein